MKDFRAAHAAGARGLTENELEAIFSALERSPYNGPVSLELNPNLPDPTTALSKSRTITLQHL